MLGISIVLEGMEPQSGLMRVSVGYQPYLDFVSARWLRATVWSLESTSRISIISGHCECQQTKSHSLISAIYGLFECQ